MVTSYPFFDKSPAAVRPAGPPPTIATFCCFFSEIQKEVLFSIAQSPTNLSNFPMDTASPRIPTIHFPSH